MVTGPSLCRSFRRLTNGYSRQWTPTTSRQEISSDGGGRGGAGRTQTSNQTVMSWKDSNLNQAVMSEPLRLRKRVIFPPTGRKDSKYLPGMQFCRTSLRRGQVRGAEGREPLDEPK